MAVNTGRSLRDGAEMAKTRRDYKRLAAHAYNDLDRCLYNLHALNEIFAPDHPEHAELIQVLAQGTMTVQDGIKRLWEDAWGTPPENIAGYRG